MAQNLSVSKQGVQESQSCKRTSAAVQQAKQPTPSAKPQQGGQR